jgi:hypothetical protein
MAKLRNDWKHARICPTLDFHEVAPGATITVADDEAVHWVAAGPWTPVDKAAIAAVAAASTRAAAPATPVSDSAPSTPEGKTP